MDSNFQSNLSSSQALPPAPEIAAKIVQLLDMQFDSETITEMYAAFERAYPMAKLPGVAQLGIAQLLESSGRRLLAIEAYRKAIAASELIPDIPRDEAQLGLGRVLARSNATYSDALSILEQVGKTTTNPSLAEEARTIITRIRTQWDAIYPLDRNGRQTARPQGPCAVLCEASSKIDIPLLSAILAQRLRLHPLETRIALQREPGILARNIDPFVAEEMATDLQAMAIPVIILAEENCPELPEERPVKDARVSEFSRLELTTQQGLETVDPSDVFHAHFGYVPIAEKRQTTSYYNPMAVNSRWTLQAETVHAGSMSSSARTSLSAVCDLYTFHPLRRFRLAVGRTPVQGVIPPNPGMPSPTFEAMCKRVIGLCRNLRLNYTLDILFSDSPADRITYQTPQVMDNYAEWLFLLAYNNAPGE